MSVRRSGNAAPFRSIVLPLAAGTVFGGGLALGSMTDPSRVLGFLDVFGAWDPTLAFVMAGATAVMALAWLLRPRLEQPLFGDRFFLPSRRDVDAPLIIGSTLFGIGWGLVGICPGPAVALLALNPAVLPFIAAMIAGMLLHRLFEAASNARSRT
ncbi:MAG: DUF6691 family protein [Sphingomicrobium sp.]